MRVFECASVLIFSVKLIGTPRILMLSPNTPFTRFYLNYYTFWTSVVHRLSSFHIFLIFCSSVQCFFKISCHYSFTSYVVSHARSLHLHYFMMKCSLCFCNTQKPQKAIIISQRINLVILFSFVPASQKLITLLFVAQLSKHCTAPVTLLLQVFLNNTGN